MNSNTKLNAAEKSLLRDMKNDAKAEGIKWVNNGETTVAFKHMGNTVRFSTSVMSTDENKFRRKVGEFKAIERLMFNDQYAVMLVPDFYFMLESVFGIDLDTI